MTARDEMDLLLRVTSQVAQKMLESGGLMHFGTVLGSKRDVQVLMPKSTKENVAREELVAYWKGKIGAATANTASRAVACCTFATTASEKSAFLVHIEHFDESTAAEDVAYEYQGTRENRITMQETTRATAKRCLLETVPRK